MRVDEAGAAAGGPANPPPPVGITESTRVAVAVGSWSEPSSLGQGIHAIRSWAGLNGESTIRQPTSQPSHICLVGLDRYLESSIATVPPMSLRREIADLLSELDDDGAPDRPHLVVGPDDGRTVRAILGILRSPDDPTPEVTLLVREQTPNVLLKEAVRSAIATGQPTFAASTNAEAGRGDSCGFPHDQLDGQSEINLHSSSIVDDVRTVVKGQASRPVAGMTVLAVDDTARSNPSGIADLTRGALAEGVPHIRLDHRLERTPAPGSVHRPGLDADEGTAPSSTTTEKRHRLASPPNHDNATRSHP